MKKQTVNEIVKVLKIIALMELIAIYVLLIWYFTGGNL